MKISKNFSFILVFKILIICYYEIELINQEKSLKLILKIKFYWFLDSHIDWAFITELFIWYFLLIIKTLALVNKISSS
jgi:hypothetical protein